MKQPILQTQQDGRTVFVTKYHQRGEQVISAGDRYEFDVTRSVSRVDSDTIQGLTESLIDAAYAAGEPNIAQWVSTKRLMAAEPLKAAASAGGQAAAQAGRPARRAANFESMLEQQGEGWMLRVNRAGDVDGRSGFSHPVTQQMAERRQSTIDAHLTELSQSAWRERRPDAMAFVQGLSVSHAEDRRADYGVSFSVEAKPQAPSLRPDGPMLRSIPGGRIG
ncbi:MAG: hypothetical protein CL558_13185 [Alphaproteobacteria bacterium]|nr:hypothetical protein [Alphaproteobacteria bacterium]MAS46469.1 hypothetical protein [Alphaproteobacteria bacterium]MAX94564.1 hypothetical protein [Alphaproteobacteria bacterium]MBN54516.1 hypothetical protein [Alphaproteobacteria bacterium]OUT41935.1 MAG: hypothetical protein CBB62_06400 [Micavibrio sp. TMED2]